MHFTARSEENLRKYLLGGLSTEGTEELELWLMSDEEAYDLLCAAEDDLIDDFLNERLTGGDLDRFKRFFLAAPERQRKLQFAGSLKRFISNQAPVPAGASFWDSVADFLRYRPSMAYAASALVIAVMAGGLWSAVKVARLEGQLADAGRERQMLQASEERLQVQLAQLDEAFAASPQALLALSLLPGTVRSSSDDQRVAITPDARAVRFTLALLNDDYDSYRVTLLDADDQEVLTRDRLIAKETDGAKVVFLTVPVSFLTKDDYRFQLSGISGSNSPEDIGKYSFRTVKP